MPSLIQQRQAIDRRRIVGTILVISGAALTVLVGAEVLAGGQLRFELLEALPCVLLAGAGAGQCLVARRRRLEFEAREGEDAGKQDPVR